MQDGSEHSNGKGGRSHVSVFRLVISLAGWEWHRAAPGLRGLGLDGNLCWAFVLLLCAGLMPFLGSSGQTSQLVIFRGFSAGKGPWSNGIVLCLSASRNLFLNSA